MSLALFIDLTYIKFSKHHYVEKSVSFHYSNTVNKQIWSPPGLKKFLLALSACSAFSFGLKNIELPTDNIEHIVMH
jgi:hypothetical protein